MNKPTENWIPTSRELPADGVVVLAMDSGGYVQRLKRLDRLWFYPDGSGYVYFTPTYWKPE